MRAFVILFFIIFSLYAKPFFNNTNQANDSKYIGALKNLIITVQKTRGETNSYMNGNLAALFLVYANRRDMRHAIDVMESLSPTTKPIINNKAMSIAKPLIELNNNAFNLKANKVFSLYTSYISQILILARTVYKKTYNHLNPFAKKTSSIMMKSMLPMTESVGQIRGFGSGLAAKGSVSKKEFIKMLVLLNLIQKQNGKLYKQLNNLIASYPTKLSTNMSNKISILRELIFNYLDFIQKNFKTGKITVNATSYFNKGTKIILTIVNIYNTMNKAILQNSKGWF